MHGQGKGDCMISVSAVLDDLFSEIFRQLSTDFCIILVLKKFYFRTSHASPNVCNFKYGLCYREKGLFSACSIIILVS